MNATMFNCHKLYINGRLFAITHTYDEAFLLLELLHKQAEQAEQGGMAINTHAIKAAYVPDVGF